VTGDGLSLILLWLNAKGVKENHIIGDFISKE
jgi:hypothetical protein